MTDKKNYFEKLGAKSFAKIFAMLDWFEAQAKMRSVSKVTYSYSKETALLNDQAASIVISQEEDPEEQLDELFSAQTVYVKTVLEVQRNLSKSVISKVLCQKHFLIFDLNIDLKFLSQKGYDNLCLGIPKMKHIRELTTQNSPPSCEGRAVALSKQLGSLRHLNKICIMATD
jgi:hypothetical protein